MATKWLDAPLYEYMIHNIAEGEAGEETGETYNYYLYIHPVGQALIMREKTDGTEFRYVNGGFNAGETNWSSRTTLSYINYDALVR